jgi:malate synthase
MGGMAAFIPTRHDPVANEAALAKVKDDKQREATDGFDGTWVAHPGLIPTAMAEFDRVLGEGPHQKARQREDVDPEAAAAAIVDFTVPGGTITEAGVRSNVSVALQYINAWLLGTGAAAIFNLMEDAATAEISRSQLWQWINHGASTEDGAPITAERYAAIRDEELDKLGGRDEGRYREAAEILDRLVREREFAPFLTLLAYPLLP